MIDYNDKKQLIEQLLSINNMLDTYRTNINILIQNIFTNNHMKQLPKFDYDGLKKICFEIGNALIGVKNDYFKKNFNSSDTPEHKNVVDPTQKNKGAK